MENLRMLVDQDEQNVYVELSGNLTMLDALQIKHTLHQYIEDNKDLVVNLHAVEKMDLTGLNSLLMTKLICSRKNIEMFIDVDSDHPLYKLLDLTKFRNQFSFRSSLRQSQREQVA